MKNLFVLAVFIFSAHLTISQTYSNNREKFVKEFQKNLNEFGKAEFNEFIKKELEPMLLESSEMPEETFTRMVTTCNLLVTKGMGTYPEVFNYVFSVYSLVKTKQSSGSINAWNSAVDKLLESRNVKRFTEFASMSAGFFSERRLTEVSTFAWFYEGGTYEFLYTDKAFIRVSNGNLVCRVLDSQSSIKDKKYVDSLVIYNTLGEYDPALEKWDGRSGKVDWAKVGLDPSTTFVEIKGYKLSMKTSNFTADSVALTSPYFEKPVIGQVSDRAFKVNREGDRQFPQFLSYDKSLKIKDIRPNLNYEGAFSLKGSTFVGAGTTAQPAKVTLFNGVKPVFTARGTSIYLAPEKVFGSNIAISFFLKSGDSITHPGLNLNYFTETKIIEFSRPEVGLGQAPFQDSYHQLEMYVPLIVIEENGNTMQFTYEKGTSQEQRVARFESKDFFDSKLYDQLQGLASVHPLVAIHNYSYKYDKTTITEGECATALGLTIEQAKQLMLQLSNYGFISYDTEGKTVIVNKKLENFVRSRSGKKDYDNISFVTDFRPKKLNGYEPEQIEKDPYLKDLQQMFERQTKERNFIPDFGYLNLSTLNLTLKAVDRVTLSGQKNTFVFPDSATVIVKKNRDFDFAGWINAGKLEVDTKTASYNYEKNKVNLVETSESLLRVRPWKPEHGKQGIPLISAIIGITGEILVDSVTNRSGVDPKIVNYPMLVSKTPSKVFYNSKDIFRGAYDSTRFYYTIKPFKLDTLGGFTEKSLRFQGELTSAGIFPIIKEDLKVMADYSLGFSTAAPQSGLDFYGTGAKYNNKILLSGGGLQGAGTINFVQSTSISKELLSFLPDSTVGVVSFVNKPIASGIEFPDAKTDEGYMTYIPKKDVLKVSSMPQKDFDFFGKEKVKMKGTVFVTPKGMRGNGMMTFSTAVVNSKNFKYKHQDIDADTSSFNLKNTYREEGEEALAFETTNVKSHISFQDRKGEFISNKGESTVEFPVNQYMCKMDKFTWMMDSDDIEMEKNAAKGASAESDLDLAGPNFYSVHPKQDSLQFRAPKAKFSLKEKTIYCTQVEFMDIADARIYPDSMKVTIRKKAQMDRFENARIVANYITKYHTFTKASVQVSARRAYNGVGEYPYYDRDSVPTYIKMKSIDLDTAYQTIASGEISKEMKFKLSPEFDYYGQILVKAASPGVDFKGATRINHNCDKFERSWLAFNAEIDPKNIQIPVSSEMKDLEGKSLSAGIVWRDANVVDSIQLYPTFLSALVNPKDPIVITASGFLTYDPSAKEFQISSKEKFINRSASGNFIALHTESCSMNGDGIVNLGMDYGDLTIETVGVVNYDQNTQETTMNLTAKITMPVDQGVFKDVAERISKVEDLKAADLASNTLELAVANWVNRAAADKFKEEYTVKGEVKKFPKEMENSIVITGLRLKSYNNPLNPTRKGLITTSTTSILVSMFDKPVMKYVPLNAFFQQKFSGGAGGDKFGIMITLPVGTDYLFDYTMVKKEGTLDIVSSDSELVAAISGIKEEKLKKKDFSYRIGINSLKTVFTKLFSE